MGSRLLRHWLHHPLRDQQVLARRHDAVEALKDRNIQKTLKRFSDVERITARLALKSVRPRELAGLRDSLRLLPELRQALPDARASHEPSPTRHARRSAFHPRHAITRAVGPRGCGA
jgi:DNA mismatch repair protein MutS